MDPYAEIEFFKDVPEYSEIKEDFVCKTEICISIYRNGW